MNNVSDDHLEYERAGLMTELYNQPDNEVMSKSLSMVLELIAARKIHKEIQEILDADAASVLGEPWEIWQRYNEAFKVEDQQ